jgi:hypothetical protein
LFFLSLSSFLLISSSSFLCFSLSLSFLTLPRILQEVLIDILVRPRGEEFVANENDEAECERESGVAESDQDNEKKKSA